MWIWKVLRAWLNKFFSQKAKIFQRVKFPFLFSLSLHDICIFPPLNLFISLSPRLRLWGKLNINQKGKKEKSTYRLLNYQHHNGCHGKDETQSQRDCGKIEVTAARGPQVAGNGASWHMHGCVLSRGHLVECSLQPCVHSYIVFPASHLISPHLIRFWAHLGSKKDSPLHPGSCDLEKNLHGLPREETLLWGREVKGSSKGGGEAHFSSPGINLRAEKL